MTREEIMAMEPGEELDVLIAEKVMGWTTIIGHHKSFKDRRGLIRTIEPTSFGSFEPSTDIKAAWEVVEKLDMFSSCGLGYLLHKNDCGNWYIAENEYGDLIGIVGGKTAPEAICKAALIALMD